MQLVLLVNKRWYIIIPYEYGIDVGHQDNLLLQARQHWMHGYYSTQFEFWAWVDGECVPPCKFWLDDGYHGRVGNFFGFWPSIGGSDVK